MPIKNANANGEVLRDADKVLGSKLSFGAAEAYKLLRTNLNFSFPNVSGCKVIGVTSSLRGEGKSTTAINLAYTMAQTGDRVLLIEADLRLPTISKRLKVRSTPGLTNLLVGQCSGNEIIQKSNLIEGLWVATAGDIPPNPAELLGSKQMDMTIEAVRSAFDVVIVDLPPVTAVSDALVVSKLLNGLVVVVRQNYCDKGSLNELLRQMSLAGTKIVGLVMTDADTQQKSYRRNSKYGYYKHSSQKDD